MSEELHAAAILTALNAELTPELAYDLDDVPPTRPSNYVEITVTRRVGGEQRLGGHRSRAGWRLTVRYVARSVANARDMRLDAWAALNEQRLTVDGDLTSPIEFETGTAIGPDEDWFTGIDVFTYAH